MRTKTIVNYIFANDIYKDKQDEIKLKISEWIEQDKDYLSLNETDITIEFNWIDPLNYQLGGIIKNKSNKIIKSFTCNEFLDKFEYSTE